MEDPDRAALRRRNVVAVQPILRALRTSSLGNWIAAVSRQEHVQRYREHLALLWRALPPTAHLTRGRGPVAPAKQGAGRPRHIALVVVGTERGLCGRFNITLVEFCEQYLKELHARGCTVELVVLGTRAIRLLRARRHLLHSATRLSRSLPSFEVGSALVREWLERYEQYTLDSVEVLHAEHRAAGLYAPSVGRLIPPALPDAGAAEDAPWPPFHVETEPSSLYAKMVEQWTVVSFYELLLKSAVAEHAARSQLMDAATQNAQRVLDELVQSMQLARQHAITLEMQELAVGAGLLKPRRAVRARQEDEPEEE